MTISEHIRNGAKLRGQCYGHLFFDGNTDAMAAAYESKIGWATDKLEKIIAEFPELEDNVFEQVSDRGVTTLPRYTTLQQNKAPYYLYDYLTDLNDDYHYSREAIADELAKIGY